MLLDRNPCFSLERADTLPAQTIERPDQERADLHAGEKFGKRGPVAPRTAGCVGVYAGHLQTPSEFPNAERTRRVSGVGGVRAEARSPRISRDLGGLRWLRRSDLNRRPLGYELSRGSVGNKANSA